MPTLIEIGDEFAALQTLVEEAADNDGELTPDHDAAFTQWFAELGEQRDRKLDGYASLIREHELRSAARKEEAERLQKRVSADANLARRLKQRLKDWMERNGQRKIETARYRLSVCGNGGVQPVDVGSLAELPPSLKIVTEAADVKAIRERLLAGESVPGCRLRDRGTSLRIS